MSALKKVVCRKLILTGNAGKYCHLNMRWDFLLGKKVEEEGLAEKLVTPGASVASAGIVKSGSNGTEGFFVIGPA